METQSAATPENNLHAGSVAPRLSEEAYALLEAGRLEELNALLYAQQRTAADQNNPATSNLLLAIQQLCLSLAEAQTEIEHYQQSLSTVNARAEAMMAKIKHALQLLDGERMQEEVKQTTVFSPGSPTLWQRLQGFLGLSQPASPIPAEPAPDPPAKKETAVPRTPPASLQGAEPHSLAIYCFGTFRVYQNDNRIDEFSSLKALAILKFIIAHQGKPTAKEMLMDNIWPDVDPEAARRNLHQAVYLLRKTLRKRDPNFQHIQFLNDSYLLNPSIGLWVDYIEFERWARAGQQLEISGDNTQAFDTYGMAESLYEGDFLEDDPYTDWASVQRDQLHNMYLNIADRLIKFYVKRSDYVAAIALCRKALAFEPSYESAHCHLMRCYLAQGQRHLAVRQYQVCTQRLAEDLDLTPSPETTQLYQHITQTE